MVFQPSRTELQDVALYMTGQPLSRGARMVIELLDVVGGLRDNDHLQSVAFVAQEFDLLIEPCFLFSSLISTTLPRPHSLLLQGHVVALLHQGIIDLDGSGRLRVRRDRLARSPSGLVSRRLSALSLLSPYEATIFAAAVLCLAHDGRYAGSCRHDDAFHNAVTRFATPDPEGHPVDVMLIRSVRQRLLRAEPVLLTSV